MDKDRFDREHYLHAADALRVELRQPFHATLEARGLHRLRSKFPSVRHGYESRSHPIQSSDFALVKHSNSVLSSRLSSNQDNNLFRARPCALLVNADNLGVESKRLQYYFRGKNEALTRRES